MRLVVFSLIALGAPALVAAQAPAGAPAPAAAAPPAAVVPATAPTAMGHYSYQADGRRDPFLSLTANTGESRRPEGTVGLVVTNLSVRGVMKSRGSLIAMVQGPDKRAYVVHEGDKFRDGVVKAITP